MQLAQVVGVSLALAFLVESMVEYILGQIFEHKFEWKSHSWLLMYVSLACGVALAFFYKLDLIALIAGQEISVVGHILSGLVIGRGANFLHDFVTSYLIKPKSE